MHWLDFGEVGGLGGDAGFRGPCALCKAANEGLDDGAAWPSIWVTDRGLGSRTENKLKLGPAVNVCVIMS
jgi:hypothetical protein